MKLKIGLFDSGVGGFTILRSLVELIPSLEIFYIADDAYAPYGTKSDDFVIERSIKNTQVLLEQGAQMVVVACNTATAISINKLREIFPSIPFVGVEPYLNILNKEGAFATNFKLVVLTTKVTGESKRFFELKKRLDPENKIDHFMFPELASCIEEAFNNGVDDTILGKINEQLDPLLDVNKQSKYTHAILGCTHYPLIDNYIEKYLNIKTISPGPNVANQVKNVLMKNKLLEASYENNIENENNLKFKFLSTKVNHWVVRAMDDIEKKILSINSLWI